MTDTAIARNGSSFESDAMQLGRVMAQSGFFADTKDASQAVVKILAGRELGFGPIASMVGVYIVKGKVSLSANLIGAAIKRSGRYNYRVRELTDTVCRIEFFEGKDALGVSDFTIENARDAQLLGNQTWKQYPRNMLFARALSNGARWYVPDIFGGPIYTPEELGAKVDAEGDVVAPAELATPPVPQVSPSVTSETDPHRAPALMQGAVSGAVPLDDFAVVDPDEYENKELATLCTRLMGRLSELGITTGPLPEPFTNRSLRAWYRTSVASLPLEQAVA